MDESATPDVAATAGPRTPWLLWVGAGVGLILAVGSLSVRSKPAPGVPAGAVAVVNGVVITKAAYAAELAAARAGRSGAVTDRDRRAAVDRLVDDELAIERGVSLGMVREDPPTRRALLAAVYAAERGAGDAISPTEDRLRAFYDEIKGELTRPGKVRVRQIVFRAARTADRKALQGRAEEAVKRLRANEPFDVVKAALGSADERPLPDRPITMDELRALVGPNVAASVAALEPGDTSDVLGAELHLRVVQLLDRGPPETPSFDEARITLLGRYRDRAEDEALKRTLARLRASAEIAIRKTLP